MADFYVVHRGSGYAIKSVIQDVPEYLLSLQVLVELDQ